MVDGRGEVSVREWMEVGGEQEFDFYQLGRKICSSSRREDKLNLYWP